MRTVLASVCVLAVLSTLASSLTLKHKTGRGGRKSIVIQNPVQRSAWECHPGCKRFCLSSCKRSCCAPGAPNYTPDMFPQLVNYQASLPPPPPPAPACPTGCPSTCYPNCDAGCCFPVSQPPAYPQYPPANPYDFGYGGYDPCAALSCSAACAPQCKPDCCRSQALNLSIRPVYLGSNASPAASKTQPTKPQPTPSKKKPVSAPSKKKPASNKKPAPPQVCIPPCQTLCKPICRFECCLPTYKFKDSHSDHKKPTKLHHVKPIASPQRAPVPKLLSQPEQTEAAVQDIQQSPYAGGYPAPSPAPSPAAAATCPGSCPLACAPSCDFSCCSPYMAQPVTPVPQQPFPYGAVPANPAAPYPAPIGPPSPGLAPLTCPGQSCPDTCAPLCSRSCCTGMSLLPQSWDKRNTLRRAA